MDINLKIKKLLQENRLREAFAALRETAQQLKNPHFLDRIFRTEENYRYMIHYLMEGSADTGRAALYSAIKEDMILLSDLMERESKIKDSPEQYFAECRMQALRPQSVADALEKYERAHLLATVSSETGEYSSEKYDEAEAALRQVFSIIWATRLTKGEAELLAGKLRSPESSYQLKSQIISAILLAELQYYNAYLLDALLTAYADDSIPEDVAARLMVAIVMIIYRYPERVLMNETISVNLAAWNDSLLTYQRLRTVLMALVRTFDTDRINTKMREEVLPEIMKLQPEIMKRFKKQNKDTEYDLAEMDMNPEWEKILSESGLQSKLQEMQEIQMEGGDVMMMAFSNLKSFPFFQTISNWFLPFYPEYSQLSVLRELMNTGMEVFLNNDAMICNSDKYSFGFALGMMPKAQKDTMLQQLEAQMSQVKDEIADAQLKVSHPEFDNTVIKYVRDLYRFFRLYRCRQEFYDPFAKPFNFTALPIIGDNLADDETLRLIGEFYFSHGYYAEALTHFNKISADEADEHVLEKIGYCHQALGQLDQALDYYQRAELLNPQSKWLKRKLAYMYRITRRYNDAVRYYRELEKDEPEKTSLLMNLANCLLEDGETDEALKLYYKVNFLAPENENAWRAIAWTELLAGNPEKSKEYFNRILLTSPTEIDYMNAGHRALVDRDYKEALYLYKEALRTMPDGWKTFIPTLEGDYPVLKRLGVDISEMPILIDKMKYDLE